jgi:hypothetical protein
MGNDGRNGNGYNANAQTDASGYTNTNGFQTGAGGFANSTTSDMMALLNNGTAPTGGAETRPRNIALLACIKY